MDEKKDGAKSVRSNDLLCCPFCGNTVKEWDCMFRMIRCMPPSQETHSYYEVCCHKCGAAGPFQYSKEEALKAWNLRAI